VTGDGTVTWIELLAGAQRTLAAAGAPRADLEARWIAEQASGLEPAELQAVLDEPVRRRPVAHFDAMVARRASGEPLQYVLGSWGFRTLDLMVDRRVLIPRPETEVVVGVALDELDRLRGQGVLRVVDLGTGSGAIALSVVAERDEVEVWATDQSPDALDVASANLAGLGRRARRVQLAEGSWFDALPDELRGGLDLVVANPPYVAEDEVLPPEVTEWEPRSALVSGPTGLEALLEIAAAAPAWLRRPGALVLELAPDQAARVEAEVRALGYVDVTTVADLAGRGRALRARLR
jgi:release factor glutamine methyltransferase